jgi:hypothetical protein
MHHFEAFIAEFIECHDGKTRNVISVARSWLMLFRGLTSAAMRINQFDNRINVIDGENPGVTVLVIDFLRVVFAQHTTNQFRVGFDFVIDQNRFQHDGRLLHGLRIDRFGRRENDGVCRVAFIVVCDGRLCGRVAFCV